MEEEKQQRAADEGRAGGLFDRQDVKMISLNLRETFKFKDF